MKTQFKHLMTLAIASGIISLIGTASAVSNIWSAEFGFSQFEGTVGGFENDDTAPVSYVDQNSGAPSVRSYDLLMSVGNANGSTVYGLGQDGSSDLTVTTRIDMSANNGWGLIEGEKFNNTLRSDVSVSAGQSRPGDFGVVSYEVSFNPDLGLTADQLRLRLSSTNGKSELYEYAFITEGSYADAPFDVSRFGDYENVNYSDINGPQGSLSTPFGSFDDVYANGESISEFLSGTSGTGASGGRVGDMNWYAIDDYNTTVRAGAESTLFNPYPGDGSIDDNQTVFGSDFGLGALDDASVFTVWFGYHDVAFDTDGDGFTDTGSLPEASFISLGIGSSIPEPSSALLFMVGLVSVLARRSRS